MNRKSCCLIECAEIGSKEFKKSLLSEEAERLKAEVEAAGGEA